MKKLFILSLFVALYTTSAFAFGFGGGGGGGTSTAADACTASLTTYGTSGQTAVVLGKGFITGVVK